MKVEIRKKIRRTRRLKDVILLREYREMYGLTQTELGKIIDVSAKTISAYEVGTRKPKMKKAVMIARFFKVNVDDIFPVED